MMKNESWYTKADIIEGLDQVTGRIGELDEKYILAGERPPPPLSYDEEDDEFKCRFGDYKSTVQVSNVKPDLRGITEMLRMVDEYGNEDDDVTTKSPSKVIIISKLNPNVPEFIPKSALSRIENVEVKRDTNLGTNVIENTSAISECNLQKEKVCKNDNIIDIDKRIDISSLKPEQIKDMTEKLKKKISDTPKGNGVLSRREKNVAISALLKLYSATPNSVSPKSSTEAVNEKPIKLFTPEYFASTKNDNLETKHNVHDNSVALDVDTDPVLNETIRTSSSSNISSQSNSMPVMEMYTSSNASETKPFKVSPSTDNVNRNTNRSDSAVNSCYEDPQVRESIKKVKNWLDKPESPKPKGPIVYMGAISYKRKSNLSKSPASDDASKRSTPTKATQVAQYKPSKYADELSKKYMERSETLKAQSMDIWTRAEEAMKEKEAKMKTAQIASASTSNNDVSMEDLN